MKLILTYIFILFPVLNFCQQAQEYFPDETGYVWNYRITVLDSLNNPVPGIVVSRTDSSAFTDEYNGLNAYHILTKSGPPDLINFLPFTDTNYVHLSGTDGYEYRQVSEIEFILSLVDSSTLNALLPFINLFEAFTGWYKNYRFAQNVNQQYQIASVDTTVIYNSTEIPLRLAINGRRLNDEQIETAIGNFLCKKFVLVTSINYLIILPDPLPPIPVPIVTTPDTVWIAPGNWIVKDVIPSSTVDLTFAGLDLYEIPGLQREITSKITGIRENISEERINFSLNQNYPNPFNPLTKIKFTIKSAGNVVLKVFDMLGREVAVIADEILEMGTYEVIFNAAELSSGLYLYRLEYSENGSGLISREIRKMLLIK